MSPIDLAPLPQAPGAALRVDSERELSPALIAEIHAFCDQAEDARAGTAAVLRLGGAGTARHWPGAVGIDMVSRWEKALRRLERTQIAKIAIVEGVCGGPAFEVLLTSDYRIGAPDARFEVPVSDDSIWAGMAVHRLVSQFGGAFARRMVLFGAEMSAERALETGLLDEMPADAATSAARVAAAAGRLEQAELAIRRRLVHDAAATSFEDALGMHLAACDRTLVRRSDGARPASRQERTGPGAGAKENRR
ncbi:enoyl-CoA-hydratase DpgB [Sphaerisporangium dianthi]|uniref:Enoyl-CoA-hydratase DpgB n=1 Tax=Sphaerisporangium dianthi TaxID=1436120 RepID=A0ABV9CRQ5_9ACTN